MYTIIDLGVYSIYLLMKFSVRVINCTAYVEILTYSCRYDFEMTENYEDISLNVFEERFGFLLKPYPSIYKQNAYMISKR